MQYNRDNTQYSEDSGEVNLIIGNQPECESETSENITPGEVETPLPLPSCLADEL